MVSAAAPFASSQGEKPQRRGCTGCGGACNFDAVRKGWGGTQIRVHEAVSHGSRPHNGAGGDSCRPDQNCIAAFLAAAQEYDYMMCMSSAPVAWPVRCRCSLDSIARASRR